MSKRLKLFGLLALVLALGAGAAWGWTPPGVGRDAHTVIGNDPTNLTTSPAANNVWDVIQGNGTLTGSVTQGQATRVLVNLNAAPGNTLAIAPSATGNLTFAEGAAANLMQVIVNNGGNAGTVVMNASNGNRPNALANMTIYHGGTVLMGGTLNVQHNNALGQRWVAVLAGGSPAAAPTFQVLGVDKVQLGVNDANGQATTQPFFLLSRGTANGALEYVNIDTNALVNKPQGLELHHGLAQRRVYTYPAPAGGFLQAVVLGDAPVGVIPVTGYVAATGLDNIAPTVEFVRLIKKGSGRLWVNGDTQVLAAMTNVAGTDDYLPVPAGGAAGTLGGININAPSLAGGVPGPVPGYNAVDGVHHHGGTVVEGGILEVDAGNAAVHQDHFRGSLGKVWATLQGSQNANSPYTPDRFILSAKRLGAGRLEIYNPLHVRNDAQVKVNRSQFFSDFNVAKDAEFYGGLYSLAGTNYNPQITVTLDLKNSVVDGRLSGNFDLVLASIRPVGRPTDDPQDGGLNLDAQAFLALTKADNAVTGQTLVVNGVLKAAGARSIGNGQLTIGAEGGNGVPDRLFSTAAGWANFGGAGIFAATETFKLENDVLGQRLGGLAVEKGKTLSFKNITLANTGLARGNTFRINPQGVNLGEGYTAPVVTAGDPFLAGLLPPASIPLANPFPGSWVEDATVEFGSVNASDDAVYTIAGNAISTPTRIDLEGGTLQLNALPQNADARMALFVYPNATLSLAKDLNDFSAHMDLNLTQDSRIRVVLRDSDIVDTREKAMAQAPVFKARRIDYGGLGTGLNDKDRRLDIQLDPSQLNGGTIKKGWVKVIDSEAAVNWDRLHYLRDKGDGHYEDYAKIRVTWKGTSDLVKGAIAYPDQNGTTILVEFTENINDPVDPNKPTPPAEPQLTATVAPANGSTVKPGETVVFEVKDWKFGDAAVEVENVKWMLNGEDKTADAAGGKLTATAGADGTKLELKVSANVKGEPAKKGEVSCTVNVSSGGTTKPSGDSGSGGGCDAGVGGLALALAAAFLLKRKA